MHGAAASAISVLWFGLSALFVLAAAGKWVKLAKDHEAANERPAIPVAAFRSAAGLTAVAFGMIGVALLWAALVSI